MIYAIPCLLARLAKTFGWNSQPAWFIATLGALTAFFAVAPHCFARPIPGMEAYLVILQVVSIALLWFGMLRSTDTWNRIGNLCAVSFLLLAIFARNIR